MIPPEPVERPKLARWLFERSLSYADGGRLFGCSLEKVRLMCLPIGDAKRQNPGLDLANTIAAKTGGEVTVTDWPPLQRQGVAA